MGQTAYFQGHLMLFAGSGVPIVGTWFMVGGSYAWHIAMIHLYMVHIDSRASCHRELFFFRVGTKIRNVVTLQRESCPQNARNIEFRNYRSLPRWFMGSSYSWHT